MATMTATDAARIHHTRMPLASRHTFFRAPRKGEVQPKSL